LTQQSNREVLDTVVSELDGFFNKGKPREDRDVGFVLIVYPFVADQGTVNIGTNGATEEEVANLMRNMLKHYDALRAAANNDGGSVQ
jgi:hypothetical protein